MKSSNILGVIIALIVVGGVVLYFLLSPSSAPDTNNGGLIPNNTNEQGGLVQPGQLDEEDNGAQNENSSESDIVMSTSVALTSSGFTPRTITVPRGGVVTWVNEGGASMWVASAAHPSHAVYGNTTRNEHCASGYTGAVPFDQCDNGTRYSFTFEQAGTWQYHNHLDASQTGTVIVQ